MHKGKVIHYPKFQENVYKNVLLKFVKFIQYQIKLKFIAILPFLLIERDVHFRKDDFIDDTEIILREIRDLVDSQANLVIGLLPKFAKSLLIFTQKQVADSLSSLISISPKNNFIGIDIFKSQLNSKLEILAKSWVVTNSQLIKSIEEKLLNDVGMVILIGFRNGTNLKDLTKEIKEKFKISENRARLIARDQTAKLHANYIKYDMLNYGIKEYIWSTSNDERVRDSHKVLNNKICDWDNELVYKDEMEDKWKNKTTISGVELQIGEDFQCRCRPIAVIKSL